ncbi:hypothetical protein V8C86DRAFT_3089154 [Haematococcus lacustris]
MFALLRKGQHVCATATACNDQCSSQPAIAKWEQVHDLMAIKLCGMHTPLNFVPDTYNNMYKLMALVDQALLIELLRRSGQLHQE